jgi:hypothetical protein
MSSLTTTYLETDKEEFAGERQKLGVMKKNILSNLSDL